MAQLTSLPPLYIRVPAPNPRPPAERFSLRYKAAAEQVRPGRLLVVLVNASPGLAEHSPRAGADIGPAEPAEGDVCAAPDVGAVGRAGHHPDELTPPGFGSNPLLLLPRAISIFEMPPSSEFDEIIDRKILPASSERQVHATRHLVRCCNALPRGRCDIKDPRLAITGEPMQGNARFRGDAEFDHELCKPARVQTTGTVGLEEVLSRPGAAADGNTRPVGVHHQFLARESVVALGSADFERTGAVHGKLFGKRRREPWKIHRELLQFIRDGDTYGAVQCHVISRRALLQGAAKRFDGPGRTVLAHQHQNLAVRAEGQRGRFGSERV